MGLALLELGGRLKGIALPALDKYQYEGKGVLNARLLDMAQAAYSAGACAFVFQKLDVKVWAAAIGAVTGWDYTWEEFLKTGARISAIRQAFNVREGIAVHRVDISDRAIGRPPMQSGPLKGVTVDIETQRRELYEARGWDSQTGVPLEETLRDLALEDVARDLYGA
jgi:aldehyde:ferredoxin oxidoreductase